MVFTIFFHVSQTFLKRTFNFDQVTVGAMPEAPVTGPWGGMAAVGPTEAAWRDVEEDDRKMTGNMPGTIYVFPRNFGKVMKGECWVFCKE